MRDALVGVQVLDLDFSVVGDAIGLARGLADRLGGQMTAHSRFGTATVTIGPGAVGPGAVGAGGGDVIGERIDLVTARREGYPCPGQLPEVEPGSIGDDLARRDFSINAMALPVLPTEGAVIDPHGGLNDLAAGVIRALHRGSFVDDPTRMMRAVRYEQRFGFCIEEETLERMSEAVTAGRMSAVSGDRWRHELERIFEEGNSVAPLGRAAELGLLRGLYSPLSKLAWSKPALSKLGDGAPELRRLDDLRRRRGRVGEKECMAVLFSRLSQEEGEGLITRLRLSGTRAAYGRDTIAVRNLEARICAAAEKPSMLVRMLSGLDDGAITSWAELTGDQRVAETLRRYIEELRATKTELSGADLLEMGFVEGPMVGEVLERLLDARLDGLVDGEEEERALARELLARHRVAETE